MKTRVASHDSKLVYNPDQKPRSLHNRRVATQNGWTYDGTYDMYRDQNDFILSEGEELGQDPTHCWK